MPASILEAGQLFASRMRMSRSLRQLWDVRERYIKEERGWGEDDTVGKNGCLASDNVDSDEEASLLEESSSSGDENAHEKVKKGLFSGEQSAKHPKETKNETVRSRLDAVNDYYVSGYFSSNPPHS